MTSKLHKGMELEKNFTVRAAELLPHIKGLSKKQLQRVLCTLVYAPIVEPPNTKIKDETEALMVINFLRLQDLKIALAELIDQELQEGADSQQQDSDGVASEVTESPS